MLPSGKSADWLMKGININMVATRSTSNMVLPVRLYYTIYHTENYFSH